MIVTGKPREHDGSFRVVLYKPDQDGRCVPSLTKGDFHDQIDSYYMQRAVEFERLLKELLAGSISPIGFFTEYYHMNAKDVAARMRLSQSKVKKHFKMDGFLKIDVRTLKEYARIFDVAVGDFFHLIHLDDNIVIESKKLNDRLFNRIEISAKP